MNKVMPVFNMKAHNKTMHITLLITSTPPCTEEFDVKISASDLSFEDVARSLLRKRDGQTSCLRVLIFGNAEKVSTFLYKFKNVGRLSHCHGRVVKLAPVKKPVALARLNKRGIYNMYVHCDELWETLHGGYSF